MAAEKSSNAINRRKLLALGASEVLHKPFTAAELSQALARAIDGGRRSRAVGSSVVAS